MTNYCPEHLAISERTQRQWEIFKWLFGILVACLLGLLTFQGIILSQIGDIKTTQAVAAAKLDAVQKEVNKDHGRKELFYDKLEPR